MKECECEHISHESRRINTPNGNPGHKSDVKFADTFIVGVATPFGIFHVCKDCAIDCYAQWPIARSL